MIYYATKEHGTLMNIGSKWYASQYGTPIEVTVVEDEVAPTYFGWAYTNQDEYVMLWPTKALFEMCFPYGSRHEEKGGKGRVCKLRVEEVKNV